jgi:predicted permease
MPADLAIFYQSLLAVVLIVVLGVVLGRKKIITAPVSEALATLLLSVAMPCALFTAFPQSFDRASLELFLQAAIGGVVVIGVAILGSRLFFRERNFTKIFYQHQFAFIFNNASFLGYPLTMAIFGQAALVPYAGFMLVFNLALFSYGVWLFERRLTWRHIKEILFNQNIVAVILGLICFLLSWQVPAAVGQTLGYLASLATPLSLLCIGFMLSQVRGWRVIWRKSRLFLTCFLQLTLMPLLTFGVLTLLKLPVVARQVLTLIQALPTATSLAIFAEKYGGNKEEASELVMISTVLSAMTLPVVMWLILR